MMCLEFDLQDHSIIENPEADAAEQEEIKLNRKFRVIN